jgi:hypothetical protein
LQEFAPAVKQLAYYAYSALPEDHIRREAGNLFANEVEDPAIKIQLPVGEDEKVNRALRQALEVQVALLAKGPQKTSARTLWGSQSPQLDEETKENRHPGAVGSQPIPMVTAPTGGSRT